ncbi:DUF6483 family protein [Paenibacillus sp. GCM10012303]|uniref:DUF6483 family protein n=1 Tax=Paenibacillus sp. GCM10012303 TaxID=3317340 RepID=UPI00360E160E
MFQRDYIMRLIEQISSSIGAILGMKKQLKPQEAMELVGETYKRLFGINPGLVRALSERDLVDLLSRDGESASEKMFLIAGLLKEEAELCSMLEKPDDEYRLNLKALNLSLIAHKDHPNVEGWDTQGQIEELVERLSRYELPRGTKELLWPYYGSAGRYADAEDVLFELLDDSREEAENAAPGFDRTAYIRLLDEACHFYERLLETDEQALETGRLPIGEVRDGLAEVQARAETLADRKI